MFLEHPGGEIELRLSSQALDQAVARTPETTPAGRLVIHGDGGWDPATLTLRLRLTSPTVATPGDGAHAAAEALLQAAKSATCLREPLDPADPHAARITYLHGLAFARRRNRGVWWDVELAFLPRALDGMRGTGEALTLDGEVVTLDGLPLTMEVH